MSRDELERMLIETYHVASKEGRAWQRGDDTYAKRLRKRAYQQRQEILDTLFGEIILVVSDDVDGMIIRNDAFRFLHDFPEEE